MKDGGKIMKVLNTIMKVVLAIAAIAGIVYIAAKYGSAISAWAKRTLTKINNTISGMRRGSKNRNADVVEDVQAEELDFE